MKLLLINGSPHKEGCVFTALSEVAGALQQQGIETQIFHIGNKLIRKFALPAGSAWRQDIAFLPTIL